ncbi:substrate binding domain-containing protein [Entomobacter blattae]|uniref:substrate binding domain-containing protein n=1 Tax=Entomobacter blattae TaxID=2762277 RepID=UPI0023B338AE|nr:substrate binding domain-containing protein [Entomobacter blattae]
MRIANLADSSLRVRRICNVRRLLVGSPEYFQKHGRPEHPNDLVHHDCLGYVYLPTPGVWRFIHEQSGETVSVVPSGRLRANNGDALTASLCAGLGIAVQPEFTIWKELETGALEAVMLDWSLPHLTLNAVMPPGTLRPARVMLVTDFLVEELRKALWAYYKYHKNRVFLP